MVNLNEIFVTQRKLRNVQQLPDMIKAIVNDEFLPVINLVEFDNGTIHIENGHHRCLAYWLSGRQHLNRYEYAIVYKDKQDRVRFGKLADLYNRITPLSHNGIAPDL